MLKVYCTGCVGCHPAIKKLQLNNIEFTVENNYDIVIEKAIKTIGIVPIFEFENNIYNEYQIENMVDEGFNFKPSVLKVEEKVILPNI